MKSLNLDWLSEKKEILLADDNRPELAGVTIDEDAALETLELLKLPHWTKAFFRREIELFSSKYSIGKQTGRLFTSANRLCEELRRHILIDGKPVCEIDVKNCQPLLLWTLYILQTVEAKRFRALVESGKFYESIAAFLGKTREAAKKAFTVWLGGGFKSEISEYFSKHWPELAAICAKMLKAKRVALCHDLQKKESAAVVVDFPSRFITTTVSVHDGILVPQFEASLAEETLTRLFQDLYGLTPILVTKSQMESV